MSADQTIIKAMAEHLPDRFFSILSDQANIKPNKKGYTLIGSGANTEAWQKGEDILLYSPHNNYEGVSQTPSKEIGAILHALYPKSPHFPFIVLSYNDDKVNIYKGKRVDEVWYDPKKNIWYQAKGKKLDISQWKAIKDKGALKQLEFIKNSMTDIASYYGADDPEIISKVQSLKVHKDVNSLKKAIIRSLTVNQNRQFAADFDFGLYSPVDEGEKFMDHFPEDMKHFEWLRNLAIDRKGKNVVLLDWIDN